jgi:hypothetical protein
MKRAAIFVVVFGIVFFGTEKLLTVSKRRSATRNEATPPPVVVFAPPKPQPVVTSLPPLTNLTLRAQRVSMKQPTPPETATTNEITSASPASQPKKSGKPPREDLLARVALSLVGSDPIAEQYWVMAINDPSLGEHEREDLIEDLNEEGFEDPKNPTIEELPLIVNRLQIIEENAPFAMDDVNARSFAEAYKDLVNIYVRLTGQEPP